jgi:hypothetical protein
MFVVSLDFVYYLLVLLNVGAISFGGASQSGVMYSETMLFLVEGVLRF